MTDGAQSYDHLQAAIDGMPDNYQAGLRAALSRLIAEESRKGGIYTPPKDELFFDKLLSMEFPDPVWAIPDYLPAGLAILAGAPKLGKSWLALQIAFAIAAGGKALGKDVAAGPVIYCALEDTARRLQDRVRKQGWHGNLPVSFYPMGNFDEQIGDLSNGGAEELGRWIELREARYVVVDTLSRSIGGDQNDAEKMTRAITPLHHVANELEVLILLIDHHKKLRGDPDAIANILGSTAKGAMVDTAWGLYRNRGEKTAKLAITGRDVEETTLNVEFARDIFCWHVTGVDGQPTVEGQKLEILEAVESLGPCTMMDVVKATGIDKGYAYRCLQDLVADGLITKTDGTPTLYKAA